MVVYLCATCTLLQQQHKPSLHGDIDTGVLMQSRLYAESISIFSQGASLRSFQLLWRLRMLDEIMLPYAAYAHKHKISR